MGADSKIEWTDHTFNPWLGCTKVSEACKFCYAETWAGRFGTVEWGPGADRKRTSPGNWRQPLKWDKEAAAAGVKRFVFTASLADVFDDHPSIDPLWRAELFRTIAATPNLVWLLLTKRPENIAKMLPGDWGDGYENVWLGTTVENQERAEERIPILMDIPARRCFLSMEPLLGAVNLRRLIIARTYGSAIVDAFAGESRTYHGEHLYTFVGGIDWVISGGESGAEARPSHPWWFRTIRDQCAEAEVPFLHKQNGEWVSVSEVEGPGDHFKFPDGATVRRTGKRLAGRTIDGDTYNGRPMP